MNLLNQPSVKSQDVSVIDQLNNQHRSYNYTLSYATGRGGSTLNPRGHLSAGSGSRLSWIVPLLGFFSSCSSLQAGWRLT